MPLPPLPVNNTDRGFLDYTAFGNKHTLIARFPSATTQANIIAAMTTLANGLKVFLKTTDAFTGLRHQDSGSTLTFPLAWTSIAGTSTATPDQDASAKFVSITGRSLGGYRCKMTMFACYLDDDYDFRVTRSAGNIADVFLDAVEAMAVAPVAVDGQAVIWNQYANYGYNAYWQRRERIT